MNIAICDDEVLHITKVTQVLSEYRKDKLANLTWTTFQSGFALLAAMDHGETFDAVFLDIYMPDMNGMEVAKRIRTINSSIHIIFLTSSAQFAVESYEVEASGYLLKPVSKETLYSCVNKLSSRLSTTATQGITVKDTDGMITKVLWSQLMYLEAMGHYVVFHHANGSTTKTLLSFSSLMEQLLTQPDFVQSHRSYVVNLRYVHRIGKRELVMLNGAQIPLPISRHQQLSDRFHDAIFGGESE